MFLPFQLGFRHCWGFEEQEKYLKVYRERREDLSSHAQCALLEERERERGGRVCLGESLSNNNAMSPFFCLSVHSTTTFTARQSTLGIHFLKSDLSFCFISSFHQRFMPLKATDSALIFLYKFIHISIYSII